MESTVTLILASSVGTTLHMSPLVGIIVFSMCVLMVAFLSSSEASLLSVSKLRVRHLAESGNRRAQAVLDVLEHHEKFFAAFAITPNGFIILASSVGTTLAIDWFGDATIIVAIASAAMTVTIVAFGEITPKSLAAQNAERWSLLVAPVIKAIIWLETGLIFLFTLPPKFVSRLLGKHHLPPPTITEGELRIVINMSRDESVVEHHEAEMMRGVLDLGDRAVREIVTPRTEIVSIETGTPLRDFLGIYSNNAFSRFPVFAGNREDIAGIIAIKDVLQAMGSQKMGMDDPVTSVLQPAYFVPETKRMAALFKELLNEQRSQMAIAIDEHGGVSGLVTLKRLVEEVIGPVGDAGRQEGDKFQQITQTSFHIDGGIRIDDVNDYLKLRLPKGEYETIAGLVLQTLGHIPKEGERVHLPDANILVESMSGVQVKAVRITVLGVEGQGAARATNT